MNFDKILPSISGVNGENEPVKVSLFIVAKHSPRLKKIDLSNLTPQQRIEKLNKWSETHRFVAVVEKGDQIYAHMNAMHTEALQHQDELTIEGKKVAVFALTDEEYDELALVGQAFEERVVADQKVEKENKLSNKPSPLTYPPKVREYYAPKNLISDQMHIESWFRRIESLPGEIILTALQRMNAQRREDQKAQAAEEKHFEIKSNEIKKGMRRQATVKNEIKEDLQEKAKITDTSVKVSLARGAG